MKFLILNGPNLNMLGRRQPEIYGTDTLEDIIAGLRARFADHTIEHFQSNEEGALVTRIQQCLDEDWDGLVLNMGAFTHYSYAILDALHILNIPKIEVHISHIFSRETFRHTSVISPACDGMISGMGITGYGLAIEGILRQSA
ncbi:MAG: type II 3-dehydroquinate dehydratase [Bacteroidota bacterium]